MVLAFFLETILIFLYKYFFPQNFRAIPLASQKLSAIARSQLPELLKMPYTRQQLMVEGQVKEPR